MHIEIPVVSAEHVTFEYPGKKALDDVSFAIKRGSITALVGPNGAGKTTLMRCIAGLDFPIQGDIAINGMNVSEHPRKVHDVTGYLSDFFGLYGDLTVYEHLKYFAWAHHIRADAVKDAIARAITLCELQEYVHVCAKNLSRGWRQRLGIAQAIIHKPKLIILDEPASGLDPEARSSLSFLMKQLKKDGASLLVSSHILSELEDYCDMMLVLKDGKLVKQTLNSTVDEDRGGILIEVRLLGDIAAQKKIIASIEGITIQAQTDDGIIFFCAGDETVIPELLKTFMSHKLSITHFAQKSKTMQDRYLETVSHRKTTS